MDYYLLPDTVVPQKVQVPMPELTGWERGEHLISASHPNTDRTRRCLTSVNTVMQAGSLLA